jgi:hypothetical protein
MEDLCFAMLALSLSFRAWLSFNTTSASPSKTASFGPCHQRFEFHLKPAD